MDSLERGNIDEPRGVAQDHHPCAIAPLRQGVVAALGNGLRSPLQKLSSLQVWPEQRMQLHPLEQLMDIQGGVVVVEPHHQSESYLAGAQRIHEASTESISRKRPSQGVDHPVERAFGLPHLFDAESK